METPDKHRWSSSSGPFHLLGYLQPHCRNDSWKHLLTFRNHSCNRNPKPMILKKVWGEVNTLLISMWFFSLAPQEATLTDKENKTVLKHLCALPTLWWTPTSPVKHQAVMPALGRCPPLVDVHSSTGGVHWATGLGALIDVYLCRSHRVAKSHKGQSGGSELSVARIADSVASTSKNVVWGWRPPGQKRKCNSII